MASVVFLRAVNVGGTNICRPALLAKQLAKFDVVNIGAVGTFVVRKNVGETTLRSAFAKMLKFRCEIMIVSAKEIVDLAQKNPFARQPSSVDIVRFVSVAAKPLRAVPHLPMNFPSQGDWLLKIIAIRGAFVLGIYQRHMKAIGYLGRIEKALGVSLTTRSWNTVEKIARVLAAE
jgi:uncharacterized protein (DUF1697 family)